MLFSYAYHFGDPPKKTVVGPHGRPALADRVCALQFSTAGTATVPVISYIHVTVNNNCIIPGRARPHSCCTYTSNIYDPSQISSKLSPHKHVGVLLFKRGCIMFVPQFWKDAPTPPNHTGHRDTLQLFLPFVALNRNFSCAAPFGHARDPSSSSSSSSS